MSQGVSHDGVYKAFTATATAIPRGTRVTLDANGLISAAGLGAAGAPGWIGVAAENIAASGIGTVKLNGNGTQLMLASTVFARGATLYVAANGMVSGSGSTFAGYQALEASTTVTNSTYTDLVECVPMTWKPA